MCLTIASINCLNSPSASEAILVKVNLICSSDFDIGGVVFLRFQHDVDVISDSKISVFDSGFLLGDGIWEGLRLNNKKWVFVILEKFRMGMITDSEWVDINNDNMLDLVIVGDWMPVTVLINKGDETFSNMTAPLGLSKTYGMWNSITVDDLDNNGRKDLLLGNAGLNLNFKPLIKLVAKSLNQKTADSDIKIAIQGASTSARSSPNWSNILLLLYRF